MDSKQLLKAVNDILHKLGNNGWDIGSVSEEINCSDQQLQNNDKHLNRGVVLDGACPILKNKVLQNKLSSTIDNQGHLQAYKC